MNSKVLDVKFATGASSNQRNIRRKNFKGLLREFSQNTACHGVQYIYLSKFTVVKLIWILLLIGAIGMVVFQLTDNITRYYKFRTKTRVSVEHTPLPFPTVTLCNVNPIRQSQKDHAPKYLQRFFEQVDPETILSEGSGSGGSDYDHVWSGGGIDTQNLTGEYDEYYVDYYDYSGSGEEKGEEEERRAPLDTIENVYQQFITRVNSSLRYSLAHSLDQMLLYCSFEGRLCTSSEFASTLSNKFGACFSFNLQDASANNSKVLLSSLSGNKNGLQLMLFLDSDDYMPGLTRGYGIRVSVTRTGILPFPETDGYFVSAGAETDIGIRLTNISRLADPYSDCISDESFLKTHDGADNRRYSRHHCRVLCAHTRIADKCLCYRRTDRQFYSQLQVRQLPPCGKDDVTCVNAVFNDVLNYGELCKCPSPCSEYVYETVLSNRQWPEDSYLDILIRTACKNVDEEKCKELNKYNSTLFNRDFLKVNIFYRDLNYELIQEEPEMSATELLSSCGGVVAFWVGMSILSLVEVVQLLIQMIDLLFQKCARACYGQ